MDLKVTTLDGKEAGSVTLGQGHLRPRAARRPDPALRRAGSSPSASAGTHAVKNRAEINRTGKKIVTQKGTGGARHGSARANLFRGGGRSFGPHRARATRSTCRRRCARSRCGMRSRPRPRTAASSCSTRSTRKDAKTKALSAQFEKLGLANALIIDGAEIDENFGLAARNIPNIDVLPVQGINVYDILRRQKLVLTKAAVDALEARFK